MSVRHRWAGRVLGLLLPVMLAACAHPQLMELSMSREAVEEKLHFALIKPGVSTQKDVYALFGDCAQKYVFHLSDQTAWMYRFLDDGVFHMACWVQFDMQGVVTEVGYAADPWHDRDSGWFF